MSNLKLSSLGEEVQYTPAQRAIVLGKGFRVNHYSDSVAAGESINLAMTVGPNHYVVVPVHSIGVSSGVKDFIGRWKSYGGEAYTGGDPVAFLPKKSDSGAPPAGSVTGVSDADLSTMTLLTTVPVGGSSPAVEDDEWVYGPGTNVALEIVNTLAVAVELSISVTIYIIDVE